MVVVPIGVSLIESSSSYTSSYYVIGLCEVSSVMLLQIQCSGIRHPARW